MTMSLSHPSAAGRARRTASAVLSVCLLAGAISSASADPDPQQQKQQVDEKLSDARGDLHDTSADLVRAYDRLKATRAKLPGARAKAAEAADAQAAAQVAYNDAVAAYEVALANEEKAEKELRSTSAKIKKARRAVAGFAGQVYQEHGLGTMTVAVGSEAPSDFIDKLIMAESVGESRDAVLKDLTTSRANLVSSGDRLTALRAATDQAKQTQESKLAAATEASAAADKAQADLESLESDQTSQAATLRAEKKKDAARVQSLQAQSDKLTKILEERARKARIREAEIRKAREAQERREQEARERAEASRSSGNPPPSNPAPVSNGVLTAPSNARVSSEFGMRFHPIHDVWRLHAGRDYAGNCGSPVYAAGSGTVIAALPPGSTGGYGNQIVIDHGVERGTSLATTYNHLQSFAVTGGHVSRGQVIGYVGTTGSSTGCHLHFETRENGTPVDPRRWL